MSVRLSVSVKIFLSYASDLYEIYKIYAWDMQTKLDLEQPEPKPKMSFWFRFRFGWKLKFDIVFQTKLFLAKKPFKYRFWMAIIWIILENPKFPTLL